MHLKKAIIACKRKRNLKEIIGNNEILSNKGIRKKKQKGNTFSVAHITQDLIIFVVKKWKKQTSLKVLKQEKHTKFSSSWYVKVTS